MESGKRTNALPFFLPLLLLWLFTFGCPEENKVFCGMVFPPLSGGNGTLTKTPSREWSGMCSKEPKMLCDEQWMGFGAAPYRQDFVEFMILKKMGQNSIYF